MEAVGLTASIISIATLTVQLGDALRTAAEFWEAVQDAPSDIQRLSKELRLIANVFHALRLEYEAGVIPISLEKMIKEALELAKEDVDELSGFVSELERQFNLANGSLKKHWRKVQIVFKESKIKKSKDNLERIKSTMILIQASRQESAFIMFNGKLDIISTKFSRSNAASSEQPATKSSSNAQLGNIASTIDWSGSSSRHFKSVHQYKTNLFLGTFGFRTTSTVQRYNEDDSTDDADNSTATKSFLVEFLVGFTTCRKGFRLMMSEKFDHITLDVLRRRPHYSMIFYACRFGRFLAVEKLLDSGEASIHDTDEKGWSLLHYAAARNNLQICQMLLDRGADVYAQTDCGSLPIEVAADSSKSECGIAIIEAGYDPWHPDGSNHECLSGLEFAALPLWRYILAIKSSVSVGEIMLAQAIGTIFYPKDPALVRLLLPLILQELFQLRKSEKQSVRDYRISPVNSYVKLIVPALRLWMFGLYHKWHNMELYSGLDCLFECTITEILKQLLYIQSTSPDHDWHSVSYNDIRHIFMEGVKEIVRSSSWSVKACNFIFRQWTNLFLDCGINLYAIHQNTTEHGAFRVSFVDCCRVIDYEVVHGTQNRELLLGLDNTIEPGFSHLDPSFLCEIGRPRRDETGPGRCLSLVPEDFIKDGRFSLNMPGQWEEPLVPNLQLVLEASSHFCRLRFETCYCWKPECRPPCCDDSHFLMSKAISEADIQRIEEKLRSDI